MRISRRRLYVGIDIHSREHKAVLLPINLLEHCVAGWKEVKPITIRNNICDFDRLDSAIRSHISSPEDAAIIVDHTGGHYSEPLVYYLRSREYVVYYLESKGLKGARERFLDQENKSDAIDAASAAYLLYMRDLHGLSFRIATAGELDSRAATLRSLVLQRWQYRKLATQATNRLHQYLLAVFPEGESHYFHQLVQIAPHYPTPVDILSSDGLHSITKVSHKDKEDILQLAANTVGVTGDIYRWLIKDLSIQRMDAIAKCEALTSELRARVASHPCGGILLSFPYLGEIAAATIIGIVKEIDRWPDKKKFKKALGVYGSLSHSGLGTPKTRQGKEGNRHGRRVLCQVCFGCIRANAPDNDFKDYYWRQVNRGKIRIKALVSTMGKLSEIIYHCLKTGQPYRYQGKYRFPGLSHREDLK